jgi:hypothetical protein
VSTPDYLTEAGTILMAAAASNRKREAGTRHLDDGDPVREKIRTEGLRIADGLTRLAAIGAGLPPCCCHHAPEEDPS